MINDLYIIEYIEEWDGEIIYQDVNYGQVLDFTINVTEATASIPSLDLSYLNVYPNPQLQIL